MLKFLLKTLLYLFTFLFLAFVILYAVVIFNGRSMARSYVNELTGFDLTVGELDLDPFSFKLELKELELENPDLFPEKKFVSVEAFLVEPELLSMIKGPTKCFKKINLEVDTLCIVRNKEGQLNVASFADALQPKQKKDESDEKVSEKKEGHDFLIREMHLSIKTLKWVDYDRMSERPIVKEFDFDFEFEGENVRDAQTLLIPLTNKVKTLGFPIIMESLLGSLSYVVDGTLLKKIGGTGVGALKKTSEFFGKTVEGVGGVFSGIIPGKEKDADQQEAE